MHHQRLCDGDRGIGHHATDFMRQMRGAKKVQVLRPTGRFAKLEQAGERNGQKTVSYALQAIGAIFGGLED